MRHLAIVFTLLFLPLAAGAHEEEIRHVSVNAQGYVESTPDTLSFSVVVKATATSSNQARSTAATTVREILAAAKAVGVDEDNIDSSSTQAYPEYEWRKQERHFIGETVTRTISFRLDDLDQYPELLRKLTRLELHQINQPQLSHSRHKQLQLDALKIAIANATEKARLIAKEVDADLGRTWQVSENNAQPRESRMRMSAMAADSDQGGQGYSYAKQRISANIHIKFELVDRAPNRN